MKVVKIKLFFILCLTDVAHYYLYCSQTLPNPFQQVSVAFSLLRNSDKAVIRGLWHNWTG